MRDGPGPISAALGSKKEREGLYLSLRGPRLWRRRPPRSELLFRSFSPSQRNATSLPSLPKKPRSVGRSVDGPIGRSARKSYGGHSAARFRDIASVPFRKPSRAPRDCDHATRNKSENEEERGPWPPGREGGREAGGGRKGAKIWAVARDRDHLRPERPTIASRRTNGAVVAVGRSVGPSDRPTKGDRPKLLHYVKDEPYW